MNEKLLSFCNIDKWHIKGITGKGVRVAVLETDCNPSLFKGRVKDPFNIGSYNVDYSHGNNFLHVLFQVAPDIEVYLMPKNYPNSPNIIDGYNYCLDNGIRLYGKASFLPYADDVRQKEKECYDKGMFFMCASGNESSNMSTFDYTRAYCSDWWYTIGAIHMDVDGNLQLAQYNNYGNELDVVSFSNIEISHLTDNTTYNVIGTSFSTPWFLGMMALLLQMKPNISIQELKNFIKNNCIDLGTLGFDQYYGNGLFILPEEVEFMEIKLTVGSTIAYVNGKEVILDVPPTVVNGRTLVPLRFIADAFSCTTVYNNGVITISK